MNYRIDKQTNKQSHERTRLKTILPRSLRYRSVFANRLCRTQQASPRDVGLWIVDHWYQHHDPGPIFDAN